MRLVKPASVVALAEPLRSCTQVLLGAVPKPVARRERTAPAVQGDPANPIHLPSGCYFHPRSPCAMSICREQFTAMSRSRLTRAPIFLKRLSQRLDQT